MERIWLEPWTEVEKSKVGLFESELRRELTPQHILFNISVVAVGRSARADDTLFELQGHEYEYAVVHLTWMGSREENTSFPHTELYANWKAFQQRMSEDNYGYDE